jgi:hypothetical protein
VFVSSAKEEVWTREFEHGIAIVSSLTSSNFTLKLDDKVRTKLRPLPLSKTPQRLSDQREAPAWQLMIDNDLAPVPPARSPAPTLVQNKWEAGEALVGAACVCSGAAPACCKHAPGHPLDWWASVARRAGFSIVSGNWTTVTDASESHQIGNSFAVSFVDPGPLPQGLPPAMEAAFHFVAPSTACVAMQTTGIEIDSEKVWKLPLVVELNFAISIRNSCMHLDLARQDDFNFAMTAVDAHFYPLSNAVRVCVREAETGVAGPCTACAPPPLPSRAYFTRHTLLQCHNSIPAEVHPQLDSC